MTNSSIPELSEQEAQEGLHFARTSSRCRHPKIIHKPGDELNQVFNFITLNSYMQPHMHPGDEKIEEIFLVKGRVAIFYFNDSGNILQIIELNKAGVDRVKVPAYTWHTYVMMEDEVITFETMMGKYDPATWKFMAPWAPKEMDLSSSLYLNELRNALK